jgi:protein TonB
VGKWAGLFVLILPFAAIPAPCADTQSKTTTWISGDDYPAESLRAREEGDVVAGWTIGIDGRVTDCKILKSSGHPLLDQATCKAMTLRARYNPALDQFGNPIESHQSRTFAWRLPH